MLSTFAYEAAGEPDHPAFPAPSLGEGWINNSGAVRRENVTTRVYEDRRPCERRDPYAVSYVMEDAVRRLSRNNEGQWLWVPAFAGTTVKWLFEKRT